MWWDRLIRTVCTYNSLEIAPSSLSFKIGLLENSKFLATINSDEYFLRQKVRKSPRRGFWSIRLSKWFLKACCSMVTFSSSVPRHKFSTTVSLTGTIEMLYRSMPDAYFGVHWFKKIALEKSKIAVLFFKCWRGEGEGDGRNRGDTKHTIVRKRLFGIYKNSYQ